MGDEPEKQPMMKEGGEEVKDMMMNVMDNKSNKSEEEDKYCTCCPWEAFHCSGQTYPVCCCRMTMCWILVLFVPIIFLCLLLILILLH